MVIFHSHLLWKENVCLSENYAVLQCFLIASMLFMSNFLYAPEKESVERIFLPSLLSYRNCLTDLWLCERIFILRRSFSYNFNKYLRKLLFDVGWRAGRWHCEKIFIKSLIIAIISCMTWSFHEVSSPEIFIFSHFDFCLSIKLLNKKWHKLFSFENITTELWGRRREK